MDECLRIYNDSRAQGLKIIVESTDPKNQYMIAAHHTFLNETLQQNLFAMDPLWFTLPLNTGSVAVCSVCQNTVYIQEHTFQPSIAAHGIYDISNLLNATEEHAFTSFGDQILGLQSWNAFADDEQAVWGAHVTLDCNAGPTQGGWKAEGARHNEIGKSCVYYQTPFGLR